jgi:hypothetical protein
MFLHFVLMMPVGALFLGFLTGTFFVRDDHVNCVPTNGYQCAEPSWRRWINEHVWKVKYNW